MVGRTCPNCERFSPYACRLPPRGCVWDTLNPRQCFPQDMLLTSLALIAAVLALLVSASLCCTEAEHNRKKHIPLFREKE